MFLQELITAFTCQKIQETHGESVNQGLTSSNINMITISGNNIFASTNDCGIFLSTDNGNNWHSLGLSQFSIVSMTNVGINIFAGTWNKGVYISTNNGKSWNAANKGLTTLQMTSLIINGENIFAGTSDRVFSDLN